MEFVPYASVLLLSVDVQHEVFEPDVQMVWTSADAAPVAFEPYEQLEWTSAGAVPVSSGPGGQVVWPSLFEEWTSLYVFSLLESSLFSPELGCDVLIVPVR